MDQNLKNLPLSKILDIDKLNNVKKPIEAANGLPNECYVNKDYFAHEREKVFFIAQIVVQNFFRRVQNLIAELVGRRFLNHYLVRLKQKLIHHLE